MDNGCSFQSIHTSGHATVSDLIKFAKALNPTNIVPIHTSFPEKFGLEFQNENLLNINLWDDGESYQF